MHSVRVQCHKCTSSESGGRRDLSESPNPPPKFCVNKHQRFVFCCSMWQVSLSKFGAQAPGSEPAHPSSSHPPPSWFRQRRRHTTPNTGSVPQGETQLRSEPRGFVNALKNDAQKCSHWMRHELHRCTSERVPITCTTMQYTPHKVRESLSAWVMNEACR